MGITYSSNLWQGSIEISKDMWKGIKDVFKDFWKDGKPKHPGEWVITLTFLAILASIILTIGLTVVSIVGTVSLVLFVGGWVSTLVGCGWLWGRAVKAE